ncbi:MAG: putative secreted hydrolase [Marivirga sp.]|jgi:predicted secreted hydrolase
MKAMLYILVAILLISACKPKPYAASDVFNEKAQLPQDEAPHVKNSLEWWYITGHLYNADSSRRFGVEYVFFHTTPMGNKEYCLLNVAISDPQNQKFYYETHLDSQKGGMSNQLPINLRIDDKKLQASLEGQMGSYRLKAHMEKHAVAFDLQTSIGKKVLLHDGIGYEQYDTLSKAGYYSFTRMPTTGNLFIEGDTMAVHGSLWYDRQWNCLGIYNQNIGWDWMAIQLEEPAVDLMVYQIRNKETQRPFVWGASYYDENEQLVDLQPSQIKLTETNAWYSNESDHSYPQNWRIEIPSLALDLEVKSMMKEQELHIKEFPIYLYYWEGACAVTGSLNGAKVKGDAYLEMTERKRARVEVTEP